MFYYSFILGNPPRPTHLNFRIRFCSFFGPSNHDTLLQALLSNIQVLLNRKDMHLGWWVSRLSNIQHPKMISFSNIIFHKNDFYEKMRKKWNFISRGCRRSRRRRRLEKSFSSRRPAGGFWPPLTPGQPAPVTRLVSRVVQTSLWSDKR